MSFVKRLFVKYPVTRGMATYGVLWPASNIIQQFFITKEKKMDWAQTTRFGLYGALLSAPSSFGWMVLLGKLVPRVIGSSTIGSSIIKVALDQAIYAPFAISNFYFWLTLLEKKDFHEAIQEVKNKFLPTYRICLCIWPMVLFVGYNFIPLKNRVIFIGIFSFFWNVFLSYMKTISPKDTNQVENEFVEKYPIRTVLKQIGIKDFPLITTTTKRKEDPGQGSPPATSSSTSSEGHHEEEKLTLEIFDQSKSKGSQIKMTVDLKVKVKEVEASYPTRINEEYVTQTLSLRHYTTPTTTTDRNNNYNKIK